MKVDTDGSIWAGAWHPPAFLGCRRIQSPALQAASCASCAYVLHILILRYASLILCFAGVRCAVFLFLCCRTEGDRSGDDTGNFSVFDLKVDSNLVDDSFCCARTCFQRRATTEILPTSCLRCCSLVTEIEGAVYVRKSHQPGAVCEYGAVSDSSSTCDTSLMECGRRVALVAVVKNKQLLNDVILSSSFPLERRAPPSCYSILREQMFLNSDTEIASSLVPKVFVAVFSMFHSILLLSTRVEPNVYLFSAFAS